MIRTVLSILLILGFSIPEIRGQEFDTLELAPPERLGRSMSFDLIVSEKDKNNIRYSNQKVKLKNAVLLFNGDTLLIKSIKTRGRSSINYPRKSFSVSLLEPITFQGVTLRKFALVGMVMDRNYWRNRLSFTILNQFDLFPLYNTYSELKINSESNGLYLLVQKADDYAKQNNSSILLRREYQDKFRIEYVKGETGKEKKKVVQNGKRLIDKYKGQELADSLNSWLDMKSYFRWLAFNYLVMNGDYTDEVYFYYDDEDGLFRCIPWDYDDVFSTQPHEGWEKRKQNIGHNMLFSGEAYLDRVIDKDSVLYNMYLDELSLFISELDSYDIKALFEEVYQELHPFFINDDIISQSQYDQFGATDLSNLESDLQQHYLFFMQRKKSTLEAVEIERANISQ